MVDYHVAEVRRGRQGGVDTYEIRLNKPDGTDHVHAMPQSIIDSRAAEYGLDPVKDRQQIIDGILHEPFMEPIDEAQLERNISLRDRQETDEVHLYNAKTVDEARAAWQAKVEKTRQSRVNVVWSGNPKSPQKLAKGVDPCQILMDHQHDPAHVEVHTKRVFMARAGLGLEDYTPPAPKVDKRFYDPAIRRRGVTVAIMDL